MTTILEQLVQSGEDVYEKSILSDVRVRLFESVTPGGVTLNDLVPAFGGTIDRRRIAVLMNELINLQLVGYDFNTRKYKLRETESTRSLKNTLTMIKSL